MDFYAIFYKRLTLLSFWSYGTYPERKAVGMDPAANLLLRCKNLFQSAYWAFQQTWWPSSPPPHSQLLECALIISECSYVFVSQHSSQVLPVPGRLMSGIFFKPLNMASTHCPWCYITPFIICAWRPVCTTFYFLPLFFQSFSVDAAVTVTFTHLKLWWLWHGIMCQVAVPTQSARVLTKFCILFIEGLHTDSLGSHS